MKISGEKFESPSKGISKNEEDEQKTLLLFYHPLFQETTKKMICSIYQKPPQQIRIKFLPFIELNIRIQKALINKFQIKNALTSALNDWKREINQMLLSSNHIEERKPFVEFDLKLHLESINEIQINSSVSANELTKLCNDPQNQGILNLSEESMTLEVFQKFLFYISNYWCKFQDIQLFCFLISAIFLQISYGRQLSRCILQPLDNISYLNQIFFKEFDLLKRTYGHHIKRGLKGNMKVWCEWNFQRLIYVCTNVSQKIQDIFINDPRGSELTIFFADSITQFFNQIQQRQFEQNQMVSDQDNQISAEKQEDDKVQLKVQRETPIHVDVSNEIVIELKDEKPDIKIEIEQRSQKQNNNNISEFENKRISRLIKLTNNASSKFKMEQDSLQLKQAYIQADKSSQIALKQFKIMLERKFDKLPKQNNQNNILSDSPAIKYRHRPSNHYSLPRQEEGCSDPQLQKQDKQSLSGKRYMYNQLYNLKNDQGQNVNDKSLNIIEHERHLSLSQINREKRWCEKQATESEEEEQDIYQNSPLHQEFPKINQKYIARAYIQCENKQYKYFQERKSEQVSPQKYSPNQGKRIANVSLLFSNTKNNTSLHHIIKKVSLNPKYQTIIQKKTISDNKEALQPIQQFPILHSHLNEHTVDKNLKAQEFRQNLLNKIQNNLSDQDKSVLIESQIIDLIHKDNQYSRLFKPNNNNLIDQNPLDQLQKPYIMASKQQVESGKQKDTSEQAEKIINFIKANHIGQIQTEKRIELNKQQNDIFHEQKARSDSIPSYLKPIQFHLENKESNKPQFSKQFRKLVSSSRYLWQKYLTDDDIFNINDFDKVRQLVEDLKCTRIQTEIKSICIKFKYTNLRNQPINQSLMFKIPGNHSQIVPLQVGQNIKIQHQI